MQCEYFKISRRGMTPLCCGQSSASGLYTLFYTMFGSGEKARENKGERKMGGGGNVIFLRLVQQRKLKRRKIGEKTSHLGPQKFISPNREENRGEKKL